MISVKREFLADVAYHSGEKSVYRDTATRIIHDGNLNLFAYQNGFSIHENEHRVIYYMVKGPALLRFFDHYRKDIEWSIAQKDEHQPKSG